MYGLLIIIKNRFLSGNSLSAKVRKNIIYTVFLKFLSILVSFCLVRVTYDFIGQKAIYGVWLTILSLLSWINFFDIGLGYSLRNRLAEAIALEEFNKGKVYVSTAYAVLAIFVLSILIIFFIATHFINWNKVFNIYVIDSATLNYSVNLVVFFYLLSFLFSLVKSISFAFQDAVLPSLFGLIANIIFLVIVFVLYKFNMSGLMALVGAYSGISLTVLVIASAGLFFTKYRDIKPEFKFIKFGYVQDLLNLGIRFFILQISVLIIFSTDNMIITQVLGPEYVTPYQITFKLFSIITMAANIVITPFWSAYTDAYSRGDYGWILNALIKQIYLMIPLVICVGLMILYGKPIIYLWMGSKIEVPTLLVFLMGVYTIILVWNNIFSYLFNGIGKIRISLIISIFCAIINIPLSVYLARHMGVSGVILGTIICLLFGAILGPLRLYYIFYYRTKKNNNFLDNLFN